MRIGRSGTGYKCRSQIVELREVLSEAKGVFRISRLFVVVEEPK